MPNFFRYDLKINICIKNKCIKCCKQTSMLLSYKDIGRIQNKGFNINYFVRKKNGWLKLKNKDGKCVFHNGKICLIYDSRPDGCKIYPLIFNEENKNAVIDKECPYKDSFNFNSKDTKKLYSLINQLKSERNNRKKKIKLLIALIYYFFDFL